MYFLQQSCPQKIWVLKDVVVVFVKTNTLEIIACCGRAVQVRCSQKILVHSCTECSFTPLWYKISDLYSCCPDFLKHNNHNIHKLK